MKPVDSLNIDQEESESEGSEEMPDFEASEMGVDELEDDSTDEADEESDESEEEDEGMAEDNDVTDPRNAKYTKHVKDNKREFPAHKVPKSSDDHLEDIGPDVKEDDGSGTNPPFAKKGNR